MDQNQVNWNEVANTLAEHACEEMFSSHRGTFFETNLGILVVYSNHPYTGDPLKHLRELQQVAEVAKLAGLTTLAFGSYPPEGQERPGYTRTLVLAAPEEAQEMISDAYQRIVSATVHERIKNPAAWQPS